MNSEKRRTLPLKVKLPDLETLRDLTTELTSISKSAFIFKYGNILDLLFTDVQVEALIALAQFYDPPMRCFLFQDFQLALTLEEFERIIGIPPKGKGPFVEIGHPPAVKKLAEALNIGVLEFASNVTTKGKVPGFLRSYLEEKARSKACINYNPVLALRQLGRPMWEKPGEKTLECIVIDNMDAQDRVMLQKVIQAWGRINKKGSGWKSRVGDSKETYRQWVKERVQKVKLPFIVKAPIPPKSPEPIPISIEEADELKATIAQLNKEKEELQASLLKATQENCELKWERVQKDKVIEGSNKRLRIEEDEGRKVRDCLGGANSQLKHKNKERDELLSIAYKLKGQWEKSQVDVKELKEELENVRQHLNNMVNEYEGYVSSERLQREALERTLVRSQFELKKTQESLEEFKKFSDRQGEACKDLKRESEEWERRYVNLVNSVESGTLFRILRHEGVHWKSMFSRLAKLANDVIETIPTKLVAADATMHPLNTPSEVIAFVEFCKTMMKDFREKIRKI
ncbi:hypothetical protein P8452_09449 [Trifolium repens]|nr:hypothetical protein P8452_09449 [Trifolium repens]